MTGKIETICIEVTSNGDPVLWVKSTVITGRRRYEGERIRTHNGRTRIVATDNGDKPVAVEYKLPAGEWSGQHALVELKEGYFIIDATARENVENPSTYIWNFRVLRVQAISKRNRTASVEVVDEGDASWRPSDPRLENAIEVAEKRTIWGNYELPYVENVPYGELYGQYDDLLMPLDKQLDLLRRYNSEHWGGFFTDEQLADVDTSSCHWQEVTDLEILHVSFGSPERDLKMWWKVYVREFRRFGRKDDLARNLSRLQYADRVQKYEPGIHPVRINLVAYWDRQPGPYGPKIIECIGRAHAEVLSAYALHPRLFEKTDGLSLPQANLWGLQCGPDWLGLRVFQYVNFFLGIEDYTPLLESSEGFNRESLLGGAFPVVLG